MFYILEVSVVAVHPMENKMHGPYKTEQERDRVAREMRGYIPDRDMKLPRFYRVNMEEAVEQKKAA